MQGPRLSSHYDRTIPDLALHVPPDARKAPPRRDGHDDPSTRPYRSPEPTSRRSGTMHSSIRAEAEEPPQDKRNVPRKPRSRLRQGAGARRDGEQPEDDDPDDPDVEAASPGLQSDGKSTRGKDQSQASRALAKVWAKLKRHAAFVGPGIIASVAYLDPGNWSTDLQAGSAYGYSHLFIVFLSGMIALLFQILATRLGCVSDEDFATHCRIALYDRPGRFKMFYRWGVLYSLYALCELGIIFTDLAELLGSAIAIKLLIPAIPLWACVLLTALDVMLILVLFNQYPTRNVTRSMRCFELVIGVLVLTVLGSFVALLVEVEPVWRDAFFGYIPSSGIVNNGAIYIAVGIIGATVMPHAFFIGSKMATMRRIPPQAYGEDDDFDEQKDLGGNYELDELDKLDNGNTGQRGREREQARPWFPHLHLPQPFSLSAVDFDLTSASSPSSSPRLERSAPPNEPSSPQKRSYSPEPPRPKPTLACVQAHLSHMCFDIAGSLLGFALLVNSAILILAAAVFYYGEGKEAGGPEGITDLFDAYDLVREYMGQALAYLFAVALLASGQSASLTVTLSGQIIGEGFLQWRTKPWKRRLITRLIGMVPSLAVSVAVGREGIDVLLVGSQVALSIVLTFVLIPLIIFTSEHRVMALPSPPSTLPPSPPPAASFSPLPPASLTSRARTLLKIINPFRRRPLPAGYIASYANPVWVSWLCWALWLMIAMANVYALYSLTHS
ncbi:hypothetical protein JCM1841_002609 [Sporobolomyces salmonicolor]